MLPFSAHMLDVALMLAKLSKLGFLQLFEKSLRHAGSKQTQFALIHQPSLTRVSFKCPTRCA